LITNKVYVLLFKVVDKPTVTTTDVEDNLTNELNKGLLKFRDGIYWAYGYTGTTEYTHLIIMFSDKFVQGFISYIY